MAEELPPIETEEGNLTEELIAKRETEKNEDTFFEKLQKLKLPKIEKAEKPEQQAITAAPQAKGWRHHLPHHINEEINELAKETHAHRNAYMKTLRSRDAQLWVALAHVNKRLKELEKKLENQ